jgi:hypothetical protein
MSLLQTKIKPTLPAGEYPIHIMSVKEVPNDNGGYIQLSIAFPDRIMPQNFFPSNLSYLGKSLRAQLGLENEEMDLADIIDLAIAKEEPLFGVVSYNDYGLNLAFHRPAVVTKEDVKF